MVQGNAERYVITAANRLPGLPELGVKKTYRSLLAPLGDVPSVWALCEFVGLISDIAIFVLQIETVHPTNTRTLKSMTVIANWSMQPCQSVSQRLLPTPIRPHGSSLSTISGLSVRYTGPAAIYRLRGLR